MGSDLRSDPASAVHQHDTGFWICNKWGQTLGLTPSVRYINMTRGFGSAINGGQTSGPTPPVRYISMHEVVDL